eukprot:TRINITY_DN1966_c0_g2_i2.p1 TRINITY_DN1966_c0_g2~~TRINITY_DN1966_c0_g2_i2.p1  ORF type:complete len:480 (+),score=114.61 TRINITY_DN1966_c0_g2_i2:73-1512(+)
MCIRDSPYRNRVFHVQVLSSQHYRKKQAAGKQSAEQRRKQIFVELIQEVMVDILNCVNGFEEELKGDELYEDLENVFGSIRKKVCRNKGLSEHEYTIVMRNYIDSRDRDIIKQAFVLEKLMQDLQKGERPREVLSCDTRCTKVLTMNLLKWISLADVYVDYKEMLESRADPATSKSLEELAKESAPKKLVMKSAILNKLKNKSFNQNNYFNMVKKPCCKYRLEDASFNENVVSIQQLCSKLRELISEQLVIPEFQTDPLNLSLKDISNYYEVIKSRYMSVNKRSLQSMPSIRNSERPSALQDVRGESKFILTESIIVHPEAGHDKSKEEMKSALGGIEKTAEDEEIKEKAENLNGSEQAKALTINTPDEELPNNNEDLIKSKQKDVLKRHKEVAQPEEILEGAEGQSRGSEEDRSQEIIKSIEEVAKDDEDSDIQMDSMMSLSEINGLDVKKGVNLRKESSDACKAKIIAHNSVHCLML